VRLGRGRLLAAVADGMGGHQAGDIASGEALDTLHSAVKRGLSLEQAVCAANQHVYDRAFSDPHLAGMGTTLVALLVVDGTYEIASVGDSRAYRVDGSETQRLTQDHSFEAEAEAAGVNRKPSAADVRWRHALTRAIGTDPQVDVDTFGPYETDSPHAVLLCTDGLHGLVGDATIRRYVLSIDDLDGAIRVLASVAFRRGSTDNISLVAVEFGRLDRVDDAPTLPIPIDPPVFRSDATQPRTDEVAEGPPRSSRPRSPRLAPLVGLGVVSVGLGLIVWIGLDFLIGTPPTAFSRLVPWVGDGLLQ